MRRLFTTAAVLAALGSGFLIWQRYAPRPVTLTTGTSPEELVYVRSSDDVVNGGAMFEPAKSAAKPVAIVWMHGWGVNFYSPTYVNIGRRLAERGFTTFAINTRMHDIGTIEKQPFGKRVRGGGYWGVPSGETKDVAAWMDFVAQQGFTKVVLIGHSAGWATIRNYAANVRDRRVVGLVLASGQARDLAPQFTAPLLAQANTLIAARAKT